MTTPDTPINQTDGEANIVAEFRYALMNIRAPFRTIDEIIFYADKSEKYLNILVNDRDKLERENERLRSRVEIVTKGLERLDAIEATQHESSATTTPDIPINQTAIKLPVRYDFPQLIEADGRAIATTSSHRIGQALAFAINNQDKLVAEAIAYDLIERAVRVHFPEPGSRPVQDIAARIALSLNDRDKLERENERLRATLRTIHNKSGLLDCVSYTRKRIVDDYLRHRTWMRAFIREELGASPDEPYLFPEVEDDRYATLGTLMENQDG